MRIRVSVVTVLTFLAGFAPVAVRADQPPAAWRVSLSLSGGLDYSLDAASLGPGSLELRTGASGRVEAVHGTVALPGAKSGTATVRFDIDTVLGLLAIGEIEVKDTNSGIDQAVRVIAGQFRASQTTASGRANWFRWWSLTELFRGYTVDWSITPTDAPGRHHPVEIEAGLSSGELTALTYNVAGLPEGISGSHPARFSALTSPRLNSYDLVLLQENFFVYLPEIARDVRLPHTTPGARPPMLSDPTRPTAFVDDGLNRWSESTFTDFGRQRWGGCHGDILPVEGAADCLSQKGFSVARHEVAPGVTVDVYNLHLEAGSTTRDQELQGMQMRQLAGHVVDRSAGRAVIVGGDTNLHTEEPEDAAIWTEFLATTGLTAVCDVVDCGGAEHDIDRFAYRGSAAITLTALERRNDSAAFETDDGVALSDHEPIAVRFGYDAP